MGRRTARVLRWIGIAVAATVAIAAVPIAWVELACRSPEISVARSEAPRFVIADPDYRRIEARSYLSYPEWYIVHAYEDFAGVLAQADEAGFDYSGSIGGFWSSLCGANRVASRTGQSDPSIKAMLYIIGLSFSAEMAVKGAYEETVGRLTAWLRGPNRTAEDRFALRLWQDYARFLQQTPWYEYPFGQELARFWAETPLSGPSLVRKVERRIGLSVEYAVKAAYAAVLKQMAGLAPADLRIKSIVQGVDEGDLAADPRLVQVRDLGSGFSLVETPRYRAFTDTLRGLASRGRQVVEIAGNHRILVTVLLTDGMPLPAGMADKVFAIPIQSRPGWWRVGLDVPVAHLADLIRAIEERGATFEHAYDY